VEAIVRVHGCIFSAATQANRGIATLADMREHTGTALGIAAIATFGYAVWASVIAVIMWLSLTIYAVVKWIGASADHASPLTVLLLMVANVTIFILLLSVAIYVAGKPMRHEKLRHDQVHPAHPTDS